MCFNACVCSFLLLVTCLQYPRCRTGQAGALKVQSRPPCRCCKRAQQLKPHNQAGPDVQRCSGEWRDGLHLLMPADTQCSDTCAAESVVQEISCASRQAGAGQQSFGLDRQPEAQRQRCIGSCQLHRD